MGRLPILYAGKPIIDRIPYHMDGQLQVDPSTGPVSFDLSQFTHTNDKPFEIHRMIYRFYALANPLTTPVARTNLKLVLSGSAIIPQPSFLEHAIRLDVRQESRGGQRITRNMVTGKEGTLGIGLSKKNTKTWEWHEPFTLARGEVLSVAAMSDSFHFAPFSTNLSGFGSIVTRVMVSIDFQGFLVVVGAPRKRSQFAPAEPLGQALGRAHLRTRRK